MVSDTDSTQNNTLADFVQDTDENDNDLQQAALKLRSKHPMEQLLKNFGSVAALKPGDIIEGTIISKKGAKVFIDLGTQGTGIIYGKEYHNAQDIIKSLGEGELVSAKVVDADNDEGFVELSLKDAGEEKRWVELANMKQTGEILDLQVTEANRGGLMMELKGVKGFLPASQLSSKNYPRVEGGDKERVYQELQKFAGQSLKVKILDLDPTENKLIFTEKELDQASVRSALGKYKVGDEVEGEITGVVDFGAFMKFDEAGLEGLIHISEIDWTLIENPRDLLKVGDQVRAKIIDMQGDKVALSLKALKTDPWIAIGDKYKKGDIVKGKVTKLNPFGAFVQLDKDFHGLAHISEFGSEVKMQEALKPDKEYIFRIILIDPQEHKMSLGVMKKEEEN